MIKKDRKMLLDIIRKHCEECDPETKGVGCADDNCLLVSAFLIRSVNKILELIGDHCLECCGRDKRNLANCNSKSCSLYKLRFGKIKEEFEIESNEFDSVVDDIIKDVLD